MKSANTEKEYVKLDTIFTRIQIRHIEKNNSGSITLFNRLFLKEGLDSLIKSIGGAINLLKICANDGANLVLITLLDKDYLIILKNSEWEKEDLTRLLSYQYMGKVISFLLKNHSNLILEEKYKSRVIKICSSERSVSERVDKLEYCF